MLANLHKALDNFNQVSILAYMYIASSFAYWSLRDTYMYIQNHKFLMLLPVKHMLVHVVLKV